MIQQRVNTPNSKFIQEYINQPQSHMANKTLRKIKLTKHLHGRENCDSTVTGLRTIRTKSHLRTFW